MVFFIKITAVLLQKSSIKSTRIRTPALFAAIVFFKTKRKFDFFTETVEHFCDSKRQLPRQ